jgi:osmotically-inducible protein OsmY
LCFGTVAVLAAAVLPGCAGSATQESTGEFVDDSVVTTKVKTALIRDDKVDAADIQVKTFKGVVQLSGFANSSEQEARAVQVARTVEGVKKVENDIRLKATD